MSLKPCEEYYTKYIPLSLYIDPTLGFQLAITFPAVSNYLFSPFENPNFYAASSLRFREWARKRKWGATELVSLQVVDGEAWENTEEPGKPKTDLGCRPPNPYRFWLQKSLFWALKKGLKKVILLKKVLKENKFAQKRTQKK